MARELKYFSYISRAKVNQLYEQITDFAVEKKTVKRGRQGETSAEAGTGSFFGLLKGTLKLGGKLSRDVEEVGSVTTVQKAIKVIEYIEQNEQISDLAELCRRKEGVLLNAFCYRYEGKFLALGELYRDRGYRQSDLRINGTALSTAGDEIVISKRLLIEPARKENAFSEKGPNNGSLVSNICIVTSAIGEYTLNLACSYKYFSDMGGAWNEERKEWDVSPHSGNYNFFEGESDAWWESLLFINGITGKTIMGTPLFLVQSTDPSLAI
jgi:hypothetical protein